jgi:hypothetical protein
MLYDMDKNQMIPLKGMSFFRKLYPLVRGKNDGRDREKQVIELLKEQPYPHPNIVSFHNITERYVDMDLLYPLDLHDSLEDIVITMKGVKSFLQGIGIIYMDWKLDNIAKGTQGYVLVDFDCSGIVEYEFSEMVISGTIWKVEPSGWSYSQAKRICNTPNEMDDWSFDFNLIQHI